MADFDDSRWADSKFSHLYTEHANIYIPERPSFFRFLDYFYSYFLKDKKDVSVLDLGAGSGEMARMLLESYGHYKNLSVTINDGSDEMISIAKDKLKDHDSVDYIRATFEELLADPSKLGTYDLTYSSLAIHHLTREDKKKLYSLIYEHTLPNGYFINMDVLLSPTESLEDFYIDIRKKRGAEVKKALGKVDYNDDFVERHKEPSHHSKMDTLKDQLADIEDAGFTDIDCYFKHGMFAVFGGRKSP